MSIENGKLLHEYADTGAVAEIVSLLRTGVDVNAADSFGFTALEYAMNWYPHQPDKDHLGVVKALVEGGADVNARARNDQTPLFTAAATGLYEVVVYLHQHGADLNARLDTGATALHDISDGIVDRPRNFKVTIQRDGQSITLTDPDEIRREIGSHPDDEFKARLDTAKYLIDHGIDLNAELVESGQTVLFRAADLGAKEIVTLILQAGGIDINHADKWGMTALHYTCRRGHLSIARQLVRAGADVTVREAYGFTPLHEAAENGHLGITKLLVKNGADPEAGLIKRYQSYPAGSTALDLARKAKRKRVIAYLGSLE